MLCHSRCASNAVLVLCTNGMDILASVIPFVPVLTVLTVLTLTAWRVYYVCRASRERESFHRTRRTDAAPAVLHPTRSSERARPRNFFQILSRMEANYADADDNQSDRLRSLLCWVRAGGLGRVAEAADRPTDRLGFGATPSIYFGH